MTQSFINQLLNKQNNNLQLPMVQVGANGQIDPLMAAKVELQQQPLSIKERLLGRDISKDVQQIDPDGESKLVTVRYTQPGLLEDIAKGYTENYNNGLNINNFGQNKGFATRLGEGLGSVGRFIDSPLGRGLLAAGLNSALGYNNSLQEGLAAFSGRQNAQTANELYKQQLKQYGYTDDELNNLKGNISNDVYKNLVNNLYKTRNLDQNTYVKLRNAFDRQLQTGVLTPEQYNLNIEALNNQYINSQIKTMESGNVGVSNQTRNTNMNEQLLPYKQYALQTAPQIALGNLGVAQGNLALNQQKFAEQVANGGGKALTSNGAENLSGTYQGIQQMTDLKGLIDKLPNRITTPGVAQLSALNPLDTDAQAFNQYVKTYKQVIGKGLEGGVLRKEDEYKYDQIIPKMGDTKEVLKKKADQLQKMLESKYNTDLDFYGRAGYNIKNFQQSNTKTQTQQVYKVDKYIVRVKQ